MRILFDLEESIDQRALEKSQDLFEKLQLPGTNVSKKVEKLDAEIWPLHEANRKNVALERNNTKEGQTTAKALQGVLRKKYQLKLLRDQEGQAIRNELESLTSPVIHMACDLLTAEIGKLKSLRILRVMDTRRRITDDATIRTVETNESAIAEVQDLILEGRGKIQGMKLASIPMILECVENIGAKVNEIDHKHVEQVDMTEMQYRDAKEMVQGVKPAVIQPINPSVIPQVGPGEFTVDSFMQKGRNLFRN